MNKEPYAFPCTSEFGECKLVELVKTGENIKLSRSCVAVEISDPLIIKANLKSCAGKPVVTGSMEWLLSWLGDFQSVMEGHSFFAFSLLITLLFNFRVLEQ